MSTNFQLFDPTMQWIRDTFRGKPSPDAHKCSLMLRAASNDKKNEDGAHWERESHQLEVPSVGRQVRSASCDEIRFSEKPRSRGYRSVRGAGGGQEPEQSSSSSSSCYASKLSAGETAKQTTSLFDCLDVPVVRSARSRSFDAATSPKVPSSIAVAAKSRGSVSFLEIPKWKLLIRRSSSASSGRGSPTGSFLVEKCVHCALLEEREMLRLQHSPEGSADSRESCYFGDETDEEQFYEDEDFEEDARKGRRRASGQSAQSSEETETWPPGAASFLPTKRPINQIGVDPNDECLVAPEEGLPLVTLSAAPQRDSLCSRLGHEEDLGNGITVISLEVPVSKQTRSASIDTSFLKVPLLVAEPSDYSCSDDGESEEQSSPTKTQRSHSVDIALPTRPNEPYHVVSTAKQALIFKK